MNIINYKKSLGLLILVLSIPSYHTTASNTPWYHEHFHALKGIEYPRNCSFIDFAQNIRKAALLLYYRATNKKKNLDKVLSSIQQQLKAFETWVLELEQEALIAIKEKYSMSDEIWQRCLSDIQRIKDSNKQAMLKSYPEVHHDPRVPADILEMLITLLEENNINPHSIDITMVSDPKKIAKHPKSIAEALMFAFTSTNENNDLVLFTKDVPAQIKIFPRANEGSLSEKMSYCAHEIQHIVSQHPITELILFEYLQHYCAVDKKEFKQTAEYHKLVEIHEAQAEILAAITNPKIADSMKKMREKTYYPKNLYEEHFYNISTIDMLWKIHESLSALIKF